MALKYGLHVFSKAKTSKIVFLFYLSIYLFCIFLYSQLKVSNRFSSPKEVFLGDLF